MSLKIKTLLAATLLAAGVSAKTDIEGCTSFTSMVTVRPEPGYGNTYASVVWYVPDTLEICKGVDCGGGRAPPKRVPGCPLYEGTETVTPEFLKEDPMKPTQAVSSDGAKETGKVGEEEEGDVEEKSTTVAATTSKPAENSAAEATGASTPGSDSSKEKEEESRTQSEEAKSTPADEEEPEQPGSGAGMLGVNGLLGAALFAAAML